MNNRLLYGVRDTYHGSRMYGTMQKFIRINAEGRVLVLDYVPSNLFAKKIAQLLFTNVVKSIGVYVCFLLLAACVINELLSAPNPK